MEFGEKMRELIDKKGLTQKEFAHEINMNYAHTNKFFTGRTPNMEFILKVVKRFPEIDLNWLLLPHEHRKINDRVAEQPADYNASKAMQYITGVEEKLEELKKYLTQI
ncbi:helix-turn-helix domain-containing protein [Maribacter sp. Hel_I_7]|uniref:helix-turn-helix domain-containing protein n=1 Tax=Maribacter sp. Hel_I_7 TaxID=1249997 RepID=UPI000689D842|nr:helix-turn-helix transcriptional regulator [Maribacter sp. Hel_I_7]